MWDDGSGVVLAEIPDEPCQVCFNLACDADGVARGREEGSEEAGDESPHGPYHLREVIDEPKDRLHVAGCNNSLTGRGCQTLCDLGQFLVRNRDLALVQVDVNAQPCGSARWWLELMICDLRVQEFTRRGVLAFCDGAARGYEKNVIEIHKSSNFLCLECPNNKSCNRLHGETRHPCAEWNAAITKIFTVKVDDKEGPIRWGNRKLTVGVGQVYHC